MTKNIKHSELVISSEEYTNSVNRCIQAGLEAMKILNEQEIEKC